MELLLLLPLLLVGGLVLGGGDDDGENSPSDRAGEIETGTSSAEELAGTALNDILLGAGGRDLIEGLDGNDVLVGEFGNDTITGDAGNDVVLGGGGDDRLDGASGNDLIIGGAGNDSLTGGGGDDTLIGSSGSDMLRGGAGDDLLIGLEYDRISGDLATIAEGLRGELSRTFGGQVRHSILNRVQFDVTSGSGDERGPDRLEGGAGNDVLMGDDGDSLTGGDGIDAFLIAYTPDEAVSSINDFDHRSETLTLVLDNPIDAEIIIREDGPATTLVLVDGAPVVRLFGQNAAELSASPASWLSVQWASR